jgi:hypothetical protein
MFKFGIKLQALLKEWKEYRSKYRHLIWLKNFIRKKTYSKAGRFLLANN